MQSVMYRTQELGLLENTGGEEEMQVTLSISSFSNSVSNAFKDKDVQEH